MQTFLPYPDYAESMSVLDPSRLGNQVYRECMTLLSGGWSHHPASRMWQGHFYHLTLYALCGIRELKIRGLDYPETCDTLLKMLKELEDTGTPKWLGREDFHASHRSNLLRKNPQWYGRFGWTEPDDLPYVWPNRVEPEPKKPSLLKKGRKSAQDS